MPQDVEEVEQRRASSAAASTAHLPGTEIEQSRMQFAVESATPVAEDRSHAFTEEIAPVIENQSSNFELSPESDVLPVLDSLIEAQDLEIEKEIKSFESFPDDHFAAVLPPLNSAERFVRAAEVTDVAGNSIRPIAQLHDSFIIAVDSEGLLLVDQHVAHERILFDKYRALETGRAIESQNLLLPETLDLTPAQSAAFMLIEEQLSEVGFDVMKLSGRTVAIKSIPTDLPAAEAKNLLAELLDNIDVEKRGGAKTTLRDDIAASLACKAAVKINMKLTPEKMQWLIDRLLLTSSPTTCPHGRPVILRLTMKDIERGFHRT
jgi:DNA mismatch repair ATPase MutL